MNISFGNKSVEETDELKLDFTKLKANSRGAGVIPVAVQDAATGEVVLIAYTNEVAFNETVKTKKAAFWSTSRNELWRKGEISGNTFTVKSIYVNCEQNSLVYKVTPDKGGICHTEQNGAANNCFYRELDFQTRKLILRREERRGDV
ncbi:MAG: phosphoribosyl-AMP cyclohydrolase [Oscillospiraceae bacterium]|nr:phosphoribosyl-AMP cyclohydrolase [Oscillospiraceae bacterium]